MQYLGTIDKAKDIINKDFVEKLLGNYQPLISESSKLAYSLISGVPVSLPASDVYSWAKSATKPTYTWSEITSKPTWIGSSKPSYSYSEITGAISTTDLQNYLTQNSYLNVTSGDNRYLKLSGGTIDSSIFYGLRINSKDSSVSRSAIVFSYNDSRKSQFGWDGYSGWGTYMYDYSSRCVLSIKNDGNPYFGVEGSTLNTLIHSGNIGEYTIRYYGNQGAVDFDNVLYNGVQYTSGSSVNGGKHYGALMSLWSGDTAWQIVGGRANGELMYRSGNGTSSSWSAWKEIAFTDSNVASANNLTKTWKEDPNYVATSNSVKIISNTTGTAGNYATGYSSGLSVISDYVGWQLMSDGGGVENPYFRSIQDTNVWKPWRQIAFLTDNVASATKLQTARTIWGQSFDGTGNIGGDIYLAIGGSNYNIGAKAYFSIAGRGTVASIQGLYTGVDWGATNNAKGALVFSTYNSDTINTAMYIDYLGNVGIGTTSPTTKFDINGKSMEVGASVYGSGGVGSEIYMSTHREGSTLCARGMRMYVSGSATGYFQSFAIDAKNYGTLTNIMSINSSGNLLVTGGVTMYSDQRKKTILNHVELSLKQIAEAPLIEHYYNSDEKKTTHVGSIAQYWAKMNDWFCKLDSEGYYTMEIQNAALASAISIARELDRYETKTDKTIKQLKKRICQLEEEVERLRVN